VHLAPKVLVVDVDGMDDFGWTTQARFANARQDRTDHLFAQDEQAGQCANSGGVDRVVARMGDSLNDALASQFAEVVGGLAWAICRGGAAELIDFSGEFFGSEPAGLRGQSENGFGNCAHARFLEIDACQAPGTGACGLRQSIQQAFLQEAAVGGLQHIEKIDRHALFFAIEAKAQTARINPTLTDLGQPPYSVFLTQGVAIWSKACDCAKRLFFQAQSWKKRSYFVLPMGAKRPTFAFGARLSRVDSSISSKPAEPLANATIANPAWRKERSLRFDPNHRILRSWDFSAKPEIGRCSPAQTSQRQ
jgi:hypothetical protein